MRPIKFHDDCQHIRGGDGFAGLHFARRDYGEMGPGCVVCWRLSFWELLKLVLTRKVFLICLGRDVPAHSLTTNQRETGVIPERIVWGYSQNLNKHGSKWRYGRGWLHVGPICFGLEWSFFGNSSTGFDIDLGGEDEFQFSVRVYRLFALFFSISQIFPRKWTRNWAWWDWTWGREFGVHIHDGGIWVSIFNDTTGWKNKYRWQTFNFNYIDFLLGKSKHSKEELGSGYADVPMPEGNYKVKWTKEFHSWKRPRWPITQRIIRFDLDLGDKPIPVPGKGENSYDIDDDAIFKASYPTSSLAEAIGKLVTSALRDRQRYGWSEKSRG